MSHLHETCPGAVCFVHCGDDWWINTASMYSRLIHRDLAPPALLAFRWSCSSCAVIPTEWFTVPSLCYILPNPSKLACFQPPETLSVSKHRFAIKREASFTETLHFPAVGAFPAPKWKTSKNEVPPVPTVMDWNFIFSAWCEQKILEIWFYHGTILDESSCAFRIRLPRFSACVLVRACVWAVT